MAGQIEVLARLLTLLHFMRHLKNLGLGRELMRHYGVLRSSRWKHVAVATMAVGGVLSIFAVLALTRLQHGAAKANIAMPVPMPICRLYDQQALASAPLWRTPPGRHRAGSRAPRPQLVLPACRISDEPAVCGIGRGLQFPVTSTSAEEGPAPPLLDMSTVLPPMPPPPLPLPLPEPQPQKSPHNERKGRVRRGRSADAVFLGAAGISTGLLIVLTFHSR